MQRNKFSPLDNVLGKIDGLDAQGLTTLVQRLARERHLLETVINTVREGILVLSEKGIVEYSNDAALKMLAIPFKEIGSASLWKFVPDLALSLNIREGESLRNYAGVSRQVEVSYPERMIIRFYIVPLDDTANEDDDKLRQYAVILTDVTRDFLDTREQIEKEKVSSIQNLAGGVAHELGNPLNSLTIHLQLMSRSLSKMGVDPSLAKIQKSLDVCQREVERLDGIIQHFLEAVRPQIPDFSELDLITVMEETLEVIGPELADSSLDVSLSVPEQPPLVVGDRNLIKQVFFNILKNARDAMLESSGGGIEITSRLDDEFIYFHIADTGTGIDPESMAKIFEPYFTTKSKGNGLGMMVAQRIMRDHGGQIGIDSRPGIGTVITLQFPQKHRRIRMLSD